MGFNTNFLLSYLLIMLVVPLMANAYVFDVGDDVGWSVQSQFNYIGWGRRPTFLVGDGLRFVYNPNTTNVLEVTLTGYISCDPTSPLATYNTGNDTVPLNKIGHQYFISGNSVGCNNGLMLHISVSNNSWWRKERACPECDNPERTHKLQCCDCPGCDDPLLPRLQCCDKNTSTGGATTAPTTSPTSTGDTASASAPTTSPNSTAAATPTTSPNSTAAAASTPTMSPDSTSAGGIAASTPTPPNSTSAGVGKPKLKLCHVILFLLLVVPTLGLSY